MKNELYKHKKSDRAKWTLTAVIFVLFAVLIAGVCLQVFGSGKLKPSEWFKKADKPQAEQTAPETDSNVKTFTREAKMSANQTIPEEISSLMESNGSDVTSQYKNKIILKNDKNAHTTNSGVYVFQLNSNFYTIFVPKKSPFLGYDTVSIYTIDSVSGKNIDVMNGMNATENYGSRSITGFSSEKIEIIYTLTEQSNPTVPSYSFDLQISSVFKDRYLLYNNINSTTSANSSVTVAGQYYNMYSLVPKDSEYERGVAFWFRNSDLYTSAFGLDNTYDSNGDFTIICSVGASAESTVTKRFPLFFGDYVEGSPNTYFLGTASVDYASTPYDFYFYLRTDFIAGYYFYILADNVQVSPYLKSFDIEFNYIEKNAITHAAGPSSVKPAWDGGINLESTKFRKKANLFYVFDNLNSDIVSVDLLFRVIYMSRTDGTIVPYLVCAMKTSSVPQYDGYNLTVNKGSSRIALFSSGDTVYALLPSDLEKINSSTKVFNCVYTAIPVLELPEDPVKEGYTFTGWYYGSEDEHGENCTAYDGAPIYEDTNLHAHFEILVFVVRFGSSGDYDIENVNVEWGSSVTLPEATKEGYDFLGWYLPDGTEYTNQPIKEDTTLTAKWKIKTFKVTFYVNGEKYAEKTVEYGSQFTQIAEAATAENLQIMSVRAKSGTPVINLSDITVTEDYDVQAEVMTGADKVKNTVKNNWLTIVLSAGGLIAVICLVSALCSRKKKRYRV